MIKPTLREAVEWLLAMPGDQLTATYLSIRWERAWRHANHVEDNACRTDNPFVAVVSRLTDEQYEALKAKIKTVRLERRQGQKAKWRMTKKERRRIYMRAYRATKKEEKLPVEDTSDPR